MSLIQKSLKRVLKTTAVAAAMALAATSVNAAEKVYRLKLAETWGPNFPIFGDTTKKHGQNGGRDVQRTFANPH